MDGEKGTEMEMKELIPEVQENKDAEKGPMEGTKDAEKEAKEDKEIKEEDTNVYSKLQNPTEDIYNSSLSTTTCDKEAEKNAEEKDKKTKEAETNVYCKLQNPTEDIYNPSMPSTSKEKTAEEKEIKEEESNVYCKLQNPTEDVYNPSMPSTSKSGHGKKEKEKRKEEEEDVYCKLNDPTENVYMSAGTRSNVKDLYSRVRLYKLISAVFIIISVVLLAVVLALAAKLSEARSSQNCPAPSPEVEKTLPYIQVCNGCEKDWEELDKVCYFTSNERLNWLESNEDCQKRGGYLAVINNEDVQKFLTDTGNLDYWIGLRYSEGQWMWANNTILNKSGYWEPGQPENERHRSCALLKGETSDNGYWEDRHVSNNWITDDCGAYAHYICQKG